MLERKVMIITKDAIPANGKITVINTNNQTVYITNGRKSMNSYDKGAREILERIKKYR